MQPNSMSPFRITKRSIGSSNPFKKTLTHIDHESIESGVAGLPLRAHERVIQRYESRNQSNQNRSSGKTLAIQVKLNNMKPKGTFEPYKNNSTQHREQRNLKRKVSLTNKAKKCNGPLDQVSQQLTDDELLPGA